MSGAIHSMRVTIEPGIWTPTFKATCSDLTADCHYICAEGCESWGEILRNEDGAVLGHIVGDWHPGETPHRMEHVEACNYAAFLDEAEDPTDDMTGRSFTFHIPAIFTYQDEAVTWEAAEADAPTTSVAWEAGRKYGEASALGNAVPHLVAPGSTPYGALS